MAEATGEGLKWELLVADTWDDPALKQRLLDDPATVLKERGISVPEGVSVNVVADAPLLGQNPSLIKISFSTTGQTAAVMVHR